MDGQSHEHISEHRLDSITWHEMRHIPKRKITVVSYSRSSGMRLLETLDKNVEIEVVNMCASVNSGPSHWGDRATQAKLGKMATNMERPNTNRAISPPFFNYEI